MKFTQLLALSVVALLVVIGATPAHASASLFHGLKTLAEPLAPEPASLSLIVVGGVALLLRRRR